MISCYLDEQEGTARMTDRRGFLKKAGVVAGVGLVAPVALAIPDKFEAWDLGCEGVMLRSLTMNKPERPLHYGKKGIAYATTMHEWPLAEFVADHSLPVPAMVESAWLEYMRRYPKSGTMAAYIGRDGAAWAIQSFRWSTGEDKALPTEWAFFQSNLDHVRAAADIRRYLETHAWVEKLFLCCDELPWPYLFKLLAADKQVIA